MAIILESGGPKVTITNVPRGRQGEQGPQGPNGLQGIPGIDGSDGIQGPPGIDGIDGAPGADGNDGADGIQGPPGTTTVDGLTDATTVGKAVAKATSMAAAREAIAAAAAGDVGALTSLATTDKSSLVAALNEVQQKTGQRLDFFRTLDSSELVSTIPLPVSASSKTVIYSVEIPDLIVGDILVAMGDMQVTNDYTYNALFSTQIVAADSASNTAGSEVTEAAGTNVTPGMHHMQVHRGGILQVTNQTVTARRFINFTGSAAASNAQPGDVMTIDADYGRLSVIRIRTVAGASGALPIIDDALSSAATVYSAAKVDTLLASVDASLPEVDFLTDFTDALN